MHNGPGVFSRKSRIDGNPRIRGGLEWSRRSVFMHNMSIDVTPLEIKTPQRKCETHPTNSEILNLKTAIQINHEIHETHESQRGNGSFDFAADPTRRVKRKRTVKPDLFVSFRVFRGINCFSQVHKSADANRNDTSLGDNARSNTLTSSIKPRKDWPFVF
jgi:hypothetical protein